MRASDYGVVDLPYRSSTFSLMVVLPDQGVGVDSVAAQLTRPALEHVVQTLAPQRLQLSLPRFHIAFSDSLVAPLQALGMTHAFDPKAARFSNIAVPPAPPLYISLVQHAADFTVDEAGTAAAAATTIAVSTTAAAYGKPPVIFDADRPFLFFLHDNRNGALLFAGQMSEAGR